MRNKTNDDHLFATWGADNWDTLEEMTEDCSNFTGKTQSIEEFALYMWHNGQDLVEDWKEIKHNRMLANN